MKNLLKYFIILLFTGNLWGQTSQFNWPLDSPRTITGNYGELRPNHFHAGLDFSTGGRVNKAVFAAADGFVSRVKVSAGGYGNNLYITHPNGKVSVYAHLNSFYGELAAFVKKMQYKKESFEIDEYLSPEQFPVNKRKLIGLSGNSGSSTAPHLHFEIRDEKSEVPLNPLKYYLVQDNQHPVLERVAFYNLADTSSPKFLQSLKIKNIGNHQYQVIKDSVVLTQGILGLAFSGYDKSYVNGNHNNIYSAKVYFDNMLIHAHKLEEISFDDSRFVNEFSELAEKHKFQKCFVPTLYPPGIYERRPTKGRILLSDTNFHTLKLVVMDEFNNETSLTFTFKTRKLNYYAKPSINSDVYVDCTEDLMISKKKLQIFIPAHTFYYSTGLIFENTLETSGKIIILPRESNLKSTCIIGFEVPNKYKKVKDKLLLNSGSYHIPPIVKRDSVFYSVKNLGSFLIEVDTVNPKIKTKIPLAKLKSLKTAKHLDFSISDNLSGIYKYRLTINNKWVLAEYDAKSHKLVYLFDEQTPRGKLIIHLEVEDRVGNKEVLKFESVR
ncbi:MAG: peptidoglycan DD-metalloendopeptidase family protein [Sphingobacteriaceae bacterium]|nr:peptidoglycan DD-metalloendopeptidase family protein [Sphingobacteriaceae bacterium]